MGTLKLCSSGNLLSRVYRFNYVLARNKCNVSVTGDETAENKPVEAGKTGLVVGVYEREGSFELSSEAHEVDQKSGGKLSKYLNELSSELKLGKAFCVTEMSPEHSVVAVASIGPKDAGYNEQENLDEARENVRWGVGAGVRLLSARGVGAVHVQAPHADAAAEAAELAAWRFQEFKHPEHRSSVPTVSHAGSDSDSALWARGACMGRAQNWARYLSDMPANKMTPIDFAQHTLNTLCPLGVKVVVHDRAWLQRSGMEAFLAAARGSCEAPALLECVYTPDGASGPPVLLAAKGVTFDSGGLCLKKAEAMTDNRGSMAGAAVAVAALKLIAEEKVPLNVSCVIPLCENMISGQCMKVGDVVTALNGVNIQIENTDMEGRLMLADALVYGQDKYKPGLVVDVATFTSGVLTSTGGGAFAAFSTEAALWAQLQQAGAQTGDRAWRLPLWKYYDKHITNDPAVDLRNQGSSRATPCVGAAFLRRFVCGPWIHADVTGVGKVSADACPYLSPRRMSGRPTRTIAELLRRLAKPRLGLPDAYEIPYSK